MKYEVMFPKDPDNDVIDHNGIRWTKCNEPGHTSVWTHSDYFGYLSWERLVLNHGPLTDAPVKPTLESLSEKLDEWTEDVCEVPDLAKKIFDYFSPWMER